MTVCLFFSPVYVCVDGGAVAAEDEQLPHSDGARGGSEQRLSPAPQQDSQRRAPQTTAGPSPLASPP